MTILTRDAAKDIADQDLRRHQRNHACDDRPRLVDREEAERLWRGYSRGDRTVFIRALLGNGEKKPLGAIKTKFAEDETFRRYVTRYVEEFERLLAQANEADPENLLSSAFVTSDVGRLYVALSRAIGRMH